MASRPKWTESNCRELFSKYYDPLYYGQGRYQQLNAQRIYDDAYMDEYANIRPAHMDEHVYGKRIKPDYLRHPEEDSSIDTMLQDELPVVDLECYEADELTRESSPVPPATREIANCVVFTPTSHVSFDDAPCRSTSSAAGYDLRNIHSHVLLPGITETVDLGVDCKFPPGHYGLLRERSGFSLREPTIFLRAGVIDEDYTGSIHALLYNAGTSPLNLPRGSKICQMIVSPYWCACPQVMLPPVARLPRSTKNYQSYWESQRLALIQQHEQE